MSRTAGKSGPVKGDGPREGHCLGLGLHGFHRIRYREWGAHDAPETIVCVHGLTRNARDFDPLAASLADRYRVVCPDLVGRGDSDWLDDPEHYNIVQYNADMNALLARLGHAPVTWIGTSLGGLMGIFLAAMKRSPIRRLVLNDVGPYLPYDALHRLGRYVGRAPDFDSVEDAGRYLREVYAPFGQLSEERWEALVRHSVRPTGRGGYRLHYDPRIGDTYRTASGYFHFHLWKYWDRIQCPVLVIRGETSDFLRRSTAEEMTRRGPCAELHEVPGVGHTPMLMSPEEIRVVRAWLERTEQAETVSPR